KAVFGLNRSIVWINGNHRITQRFVLGIQSIDSVFISNYIRTMVTRKNNDKTFCIGVLRQRMHLSYLDFFSAKSKGLRKFVLRNIKPQPSVPSTEQRYDRIRNSSLFTSDKKRI